MCMGGSIPVCVSPLPSLAVCSSVSVSLSFSVSPASSVVLEFLVLSGAAGVVWL